MEHSVTGKISLLATIAPSSVREIRATRRMNNLKAQASDTLEGLLRPLVLVVDDDKEFRGVLQSHLQASELCRSVAVATAAEALRVLTSRPVQLVVTDYHMPVIDGVALLRVVRQRWPRVIRVLMSGSQASSAPRGDLMRRFVRKQESLMEMTDILLGLIPE